MRAGLDLWAADHAVELVIIDARGSPDRDETGAVLADVGDPTVPCVRAIG